MNLKDAYEKKLNSKIDALKADIDKLKAKATDLEGDAQVEVNKKVEELKSIKQKAESGLEKIKAAQEDSWEHLKIDIDRTWENVTRSIESIKSKFKL